MNDHDNINIDDELKDSPLLKSMNRENPFKVPEGYFESFPSLISEKIATQNSKPQWVIFLKNIFQPKYAVALLLFAVVLTSGIFYFNRNTSVKYPEVLLSYDDLNGSNYIEQMDENDLIDAYASSSSETGKSGENSADIENYLIDNHTDITLIENEL